MSNSVYKNSTQTSVYKSDDSVYIEANFDVKKSREDSQYVFGWANIARNADGSIPLDWQGDVVPVDVLEQAAYDFCLNYRATGEMHQGTQKGDMIESVMFTKEKMAALGIPEGTLPEGWWVGFHIPDPDVFAKIKNGEYRMFSIQGQAKRTPI